MWAAQHYACKEANSFITSGGLGSMGYEVPAAMGAQLGKPDRVVWSVAGDGGFQMTMSELATIVENNIPVKFAIFNNGNLGMVRQWQEVFYNKDYFATWWTRNPDFLPGKRLQLSWRNLWQRRHDHSYSRTHHCSLSPRQTWGIKPSCQYV
jgi:thiamine pyrophosphate-dependent acetolactate synthase large subunit-like protein